MHDIGDWTGVDTVDKMSVPRTAKKESDCSAFETPKTGLSSDFYAANLNRTRTVSKKEVATKSIPELRRQHSTMKAGIRVEELILEEV